MNKKIRQEIDEIQERLIAIAEEERSKFERMPENMIFGDRAIEWEGEIDAIDEAINNLGRINY